MAKKPSAPSAAAIASFWNWFAANSEGLLKLDVRDESARGKLFDVLHERLRKIHDSLAFELSVTTSPRELVVSAEGNLEAFPAVEATVDAAPALKGWKFVKFRQPSGSEITLEFGKHRISARTVQVVLAPGEDGAIAMMVYLNAPVPEEDCAGVGFVLLDAVLGEHVVATRLGEIGFLPTGVPEDLEPYAIELREAGEAVAAMWREMHTGA